MESFDVLVVGAGFAGTVCARRMAEEHLRVLVIDTRPDIGGNAHDSPEGADDGEQLDVVDRQRDQIRPRQRLGVGEQHLVAGQQLLGVDQHDEARGAQERIGQRGSREKSIAETARRAA